MDKTFKITWSDELGRDWMNIFNLELCLFSKERIGGKAKDMVTVKEVVEEEQLSKSFPDENSPSLSREQGSVANLPDRAPQ